MGGSGWTGGWGGCWCLGCLQKQGLTRARTLYPNLRREHFRAAPHTQPIGFPKEGNLLSYSSSNNCRASSWPLGHGVVPWHGTAWFEPIYAQRNSWKKFFLMCLSLPFNSDFRNFPFPSIRHAGTKLLFQKLWSCFCLERPYLVSQVWEKVSYPTCNPWEPPEPRPPSVTCSLLPTQVFAVPTFWAFTLVDSQCPGGNISSSFQAFNEAPTLSCSELSLVLLENSMSATRTC